MFQYRVSHAGVDKATRGAGDQFAVFQVRNDVIRIFPKVFSISFSPVGKFCCGTEQMRLQKIRIFNSKNCFFRLCVEEGIRVVCIELIDRVLSSNKGNSCFLSLSSGAACLLEHGYHRAGISADDNGIQISYVDTNLQRIGTDNPGDSSLFEVRFNFFPLLRTVAAAVGGNAVCRTFLSQAKGCHLRAGSGFGKADGLPSFADTFLHHLSCRSRCALFRIPVNPKSPLCPRRAVGGDFFCGKSGQCFGERFGISKCCRGENKLRISIIIIADSPKPSQEKSRVRAENTPVFVRLVNYDKGKVRKEIPPLCPPRKNVVELIHVG